MRPGADGGKFYFKKWYDRPGNSRYLLLKEESCRTIQLEWNRGYSPSLGIEAGFFLFLPGKGSNVLGRQRNGNNRICKGRNASNHGT